MKKIQVVGVRAGKRVVNWPGLLVAYTLMWIASATAIWLVDVLASVFFGDESSRALAASMRMAFVVSAVMLAIFVLKIWSMPVARLPELGPRS